MREAQDHKWCNRAIALTTGIGKSGYWAGDGQTGTNPPDREMVLISAG